MSELHNQGCGIASLVLGILSLLILWIPFIGLICAILGIIFSAKQRKIKKCGISSAGLVLSIIGICFTGLFNFFFIIGVLFV